MGAQTINTVQPMPEQTAPSAIPGGRIYVDMFNSGRLPTSLTGKRLLGLANQKETKFSLKPDLAPVSAGATNIVLENIFKGWNGKLNCAIQDMNPLAMEVANGTNIKTVDTQPSSPVTANTAATGSTTSKLKMATGGATVFSTYVGKRILIPQTDSNAPVIRGIIRSVDAANEWIYLLYELDEVPAASAAVYLLEGLEQDLGGGAPLLREVIIANDFNHGDSNRQTCWRCQPVSGFDQTQSNDDAQKTMIEFDLLGYTKLSAGAGNTYQIAPSTINVLYGTIPVN